MGEILASVLDCQLERLISNEGPALGAAVTALAGLESYLRTKMNIAEKYTVADAVTTMVQFRDAVVPNAVWRDAYRAGLNHFEQRIGAK
jgi:sugar (pentulose or hexulose) kinase